MRRAFIIIFDDNFSRRVFLEGSRGWRPVPSCVVLKAEFCSSVRMLLICQVGSEPVPGTPGPVLSLQICTNVLGAQCLGQGGRGSNHGSQLKKRRTNKTLARNAIQTGQNTKIQNYVKTQTLENNSRKVPVAKLGTPLERLALKSYHRR